MNNTAGEVKLLDSPGETNSRSKVVMAYSTDKDIPVLVLRTCYRAYALRQMLFSSDERRAPYKEGGLCLQPVLKRKVGMGEQLPHPHLLIF